MPMIRQEPQRGFTLLEMIVAIGIFSIVMLVATSAYFNLIALDRRARATNQVVNNLSFAVDAMVRGIRTGKNYQCLNGSPYGGGNSTSGTCTQFSYTDSTLSGNNVVTYFLKSNGTIGRCEWTTPLASDSCASSITDPAIAITKLVFYVRGVGTTPGDTDGDTQPQVLFTVAGAMPADSQGNRTTFVIEETATQRLIDL